MKFKLKVALGDVVSLLALEASNAAQAPLVAESQGFSVLNI